MEALAASGGACAPPDARARLAVDLPELLELLLGVLRTEEPLVRADVLLREDLRRHDHLIRRGDGLVVEEARERVHGVPALKRARETGPHLLFPTAESLEVRRVRALA